MYSEINFPTWAAQIMITPNGYAYQGYTMYVAMMQQGVAIDEAVHLVHAYHHIVKQPENMPAIEAYYGLTLAIWQFSPDSDQLKNRLASIRSFITNDLDKNLHEAYSLHPAYIEHRKQLLEVFLDGMTHTKGSREAISISDRLMQLLLEQHKLDQIRQSILMYQTQPSERTTALTLSKDRPTLIVANGVVVNLLPTKSDKRTKWQVKIAAHELLNTDQPPNTELRVSKAKHTTREAPDTEWILFDDSELGTQSVFVWLRAANGAWTHTETYVLVQHPFMDLPQAAKPPEVAFQAVKLLAYSGLAAPLSVKSEAWECTIAPAQLLRSTIPQGYSLRINQSAGAPMQEELRLQSDQLGTQTMIVYLLNDRQEVVTKVETYLLVQTLFNFEAVLQIQSACPQLLSGISDQFLLLKNGIAIGNYRGEKCSMHVSEVLHPQSMHLLDRCFFINQEMDRSKVLHFDLHQLGTKVVTVLYEGPDQKVHIMQTYVLVLGYS